MRTSSLSRRCFLRTMALLAPSAALAACGRAPQAVSEETWYADHQKDILKEVENTFNHVRPLLVEAYGEADSTDLYTRTLDTYQTILLELPYIGGFSNDLTSNLCNGAAALAFYQVLSAYGEKTEAIGRLLYKGVERQFSSDPMAKMMGRLANSQPAQDKLKLEAEQSQKRTYPEDWVFSFIPGSPDTFDFGIDYTECGICKLFKLYDAEDFTPYLCLLDGPISQVMGTGLVRTQTLAQGDDRCDFRYKTGRDVQLEWNPGFVQGGK